MKPLWRNVWPFFVLLSRLQNLRLSFSFLCCCLKKKKEVNWHMKRSKGWTHYQHELVALNIRARLSDHPWFLLQTKATNTTGDTNGGAFMQPLVCVRECLCTCKTCESAGEYVQVSTGMYRWECIFLHRCPCKWALETLHTLFVLHLMLCLFLYPGRVWSPWR